MVPTYTTPGGVPEYYVAWVQADTPYLIVGDTLTGQVRATVKAPGNVYLTGVYGTAGADSTFVVTGEFLPSRRLFIAAPGPGSSSSGRR
jgi:hypothetical protein